MKIFAKIVAMFVIIWGIMNILTAWFYIAWTAMEQGSGQILEQMIQNRATSNQDYQQIQEQISYLKSHTKVLALTATFFLLLGPLGVMSGVMLWRKKFPYFSLIISIAGVIGEMLAWAHFQQLGIVNWVGLGVLSSGILLSIIQIWKQRSYIVRIPLEADIKPVPITQLPEQLALEPKEE